MDMEESVLRIPGEVVFREEPDGAFLYDSRTGAVHGVNPVGAFICRSLKKGGMRPGEICARMAGFYDVGPTDDRMKAEVSEFLQRLMTLGFLVSREQKGPGSLPDGGGAG